VQRNRSKLVLALVQDEAAVLPRKPKLVRWRSLTRVILGVLLLPPLAAVGLLVFLMLAPAHPAPESKLVHAPRGVDAIGGRGQITVQWNETPGAVRYHVFRAPEPGGPFSLVSTFQPNLPEPAHRIADYFFPDRPFEGVPHTPFVDTFVQPNRRYYYRVAASDGSYWSKPSLPVLATASDVAAGGIHLRVDAARPAGMLTHNWEICLSSEHLSYMLKGDLNEHLRAAGSGLRQAHQRLQQEFGFRYIRAHGILMDDLHVYRQDTAGRPIYDWTGVDRLYDMLLADGLRPIVELSFMPSALAVNPTETGMVTSYFGGLISKPRDYQKWGGLVAGLTRHLVERYGREEVESWYFEVWNEPDFRMPWFHGFWTGSDEDYFRLYDYSVQAVKSVDPKLRVGGPVAATTRLVEPFLRHVTTEDFATGGNSAPLDFLDLHTYFAPPSNWRPLLERYGLGRLPIFVSEWGVDTWWGREENDLPYGAAWTARGLFEGSGNASMISYWCGSDYYEENGPPPRFFHGGFGLLGIDGVRKPRYWAFHLLHALGTRRIAVDGDGDGFGGLVQAWATRTDDGAVRILVWNVTYDQTKARGSDALARQVSLVVTGLLPGQRFCQRHYRVDNTHSNVYGAWQAMGRPDWPNAQQLAELHRRDELEMLEPERSGTSDASGKVQLQFGLPMPSLSLIELAPVRNGE